MSGLDRFLFRITHLRARAKKGPHLRVPVNVLCETFTGHLRVIYGIYSVIYGSFTDVAFETRCHLSLTPPL